MHLILLPALSPSILPSSTLLSILPSMLSTLTENGRLSVHSVLLLIQLSILLPILSPSVLPSSIPLWTKEEVGGGGGGPSTPFRMRGTPLPWPSARRAPAKSEALHRRTWGGKEEDTHNAVDRWRKGAREGGKEWSEGGEGGTGVRGG